MSENNKDNISWTINVSLTTGEIRAHIYILPPFLDEATKNIDTIVKRISNAFNKKGLGLLVLENPSTIYNSSHITSIKWDFIGSDEFMKTYRESIKCRMGYIK